MPSPNTETGGAREARAPLLDVLKAAKWFGWALSTYFIGICHPIFFRLLPIHILLAGRQFIFYGLPCSIPSGSLGEAAEDCLPEGFAPGKTF